MSSALLAFQLLSFSMMTVQYVSWYSCANGFLPDCGLENAQKRQWTVMGCVRLFRVEEGCVPWHGKWITLIPQELWPVIFFSWTEKSSAILLGRFDDPLFSLLSPFHWMSHKHTPLPLSTSPAAAWEWTGALSFPSQAWAINYKQPCLRLGRNDCRKPAQWCTANTPSPKYIYFQHKPIL